MPSFFAVVARGIEELLAKELQQIGVNSCKVTAAGVAFEANWKQAYRVVLHTRLASKVLYTLRSFQASTEEELYEGVAAFPWEEHFGVAHSFAIDAVLKRAPIQHRQYVAQRMKDGIVDRFKNRTGQRPSVERQYPDIRLHLLWHNHQATLSLDLGGQSLHQRGYRKQMGEAPLKENLAAAMLYRAGWPEKAVHGESLVDPFCGAGTLVIEAALMAADIAPGLLNPHLGAPAWHHFKPDLWRELWEEATERRNQGLAALKSTFLGTDRDGRILAAARNNADRAGLAQFIDFERRAVNAWQPTMTEALKPGLVIANPPYGERMGALPEAIQVFSEFGETLRGCFLNWEAMIITGDRVLGKHLALRAHKVNSIKNGPLECSLLRFHIIPERFAGADAGKSSDGKPSSRTPGEQMFANRLAKNRKNLAKWLKREKVQCYRLYDADMPEYKVAVDIYKDQVLVQEYQAPKSIDPRQAEKRFHEVLRVVPDALEIPANRMIVKQRRKQKGRDQYFKLDDVGRSKLIEENGLKFEVNLTDYLDTGLFLDHRQVRQKIRELSSGKRFLNLFAYTGTATVYAAAGGASMTTTVDMSRNYIEWAERNMMHNRLLARKHEFLQDDCLAWLPHCRQRYDLIFLDPPTFSNSKRMDATLDIQRDHVDLIDQVLKLLAPGGKLIFSNNARRFKLEEERLKAKGVTIRDWTRATMPPDFQRNSAIHQVWLIEKPSS